MARKHRQSRSARAGIAATAARLLAIGSASDFDAAKRKAARELGQDERRNLPDNREVHDALVDYLALFGGAGHEARISHLRRIALDAMAGFDAFRPRLAGPVLHGTALEDSPVTLHVFTGEVEALTRFLIDRRVVFELDEAPFRFRRDGAPERISVFRMEYAGAILELAVFPDGDAGRPPLSPIDGRPMARASHAALRTLIDSGEVFPPGRGIANGSAVV